MAIKSVNFNKSAHLLAFVAGGFYALGFPNIAQFPLFFGPLLAVGILFSISKIDEIQNWKEFKKFTLRPLLTFFLSCTIFGYYWLPYTFKEFGSIIFPFNYLLSSLFLFIVIPQFWVAFMALFLIKKKLGSYWKNESLLLKSIFISIIFVTAEIFVPQQFPTHLGHSWLFLAPYIGLAPILGVPIYSFIGYLISFFLAGLFIQKKARWIFLIYTFPFVIIGLIFKIPTYQKQSDLVPQHQIRIVQANIGNYLKLSSEGGELFSIKKIMNFYQRMSTAPSPMPLDLIIWPETAYPYSLDSELIIERPFLGPKIFHEITNVMDAELLIGGYAKNYQNHNTLDFETVFNTAFHFSKKGRLLNSYHKHRLIPFGETLPLGPLNKILAPYLHNISYFAKGQSLPLFQMKNGGTFITPICYEILSPTFMREYINSNSSYPQFIVNLTNDSWYGDTIEPYQHLFLSKWRAVEFNLPVIRSTNTGISSILYPDGTEGERLNIGQRDKLDISLNHENRTPTFYSRWGNLSIFLIMFIIFLFSIPISRHSNFINDRCLNKK